MTDQNMIIAIGVTACVAIFTTAARFLVFEHLRMRSARQFRGDVIDGRPKADWYSLEAGNQKKAYPDA